MALGTTIGWADATINTGYGCTRVSPGCKNCYMFRMLKGENGRRLNPNPTSPLRIEHTVFADRIKTLGHSPKRVFFNSMTDTFHDAYEDEVLDRWFELIGNEGSRHTWLVLTKRAGRMAEYFAHRGTPPTNVWLGVSVETRKQYDRITILRKITCTRRFLSVEPLLEPVPDLPLLGIDWVLVGGESDYHSPRPFHEDWARQIRDRCTRANIPFFYKQSGGTVNHGGHWGTNVLDGRTWEQFPPLAAGQTSLLEVAAQ